MTARIYLPRPLASGAEVQVSGEVHARLSRVLRLGSGDALVLFDGSGREWAATVRSVGRTATTLALGDEARPQREPPRRVHLYQAVIRPALLELVLEKGTEIGVTSFTPLLSERSARAKELSPARMERLHRIIVEAAEQSGRVRLPELGPPRTLLDAVCSASGRVVLAHARAGGAVPFVSDFAAAEEVSLLVGPEGGFSDEEVAAASAAGATVAVMGRTVLRSETAGIAGAALLLLGREVQVRE